MATRVRIDENRMTQVDGQPFFPITARHMPTGATPALLAKAGFNALRWTPFGMDEFERDSFEVPDDFGGLMFYAYLFNRGDLSTDPDRRKRELAALVRAIKDHPKLLGYEQRNEPAYTFMDQAVAQSPPKGLIAGSDVVRSIDPDHPIRIGHMCSNLVSTLRKYNPAAEIVSCNPYMVMAPGIRRFVGSRPDGKLADCPDQTISAVGQYTRKMMRVAQGRQVWMQIHGAANENWYNPNHTPETRNHGLYEHHRLYPSYWQMRFMAFNAIVRGATGLEWMLISLPVEASVWLDVQKIIGQLHCLHDVLASPPLDHNLDVEYTELGFGDWDGVESLVKLCNGKPYILSVNTQFDPMIATFSNLPPGLSGKLDVIDEDRQVEIEGGTFTDRFQPYEVHVYVSAIEP